MVRKLLMLAVLMGQSGCAMTGVGQETSIVTPGLDRTSLDDCFDAQARLVPFSGVVLIERGRNEFVRTSGFADAEGKEEITRKTRFRLASVTKVITRAAIGKLVENGRIALDAPIGRYVADLPPPMAAVTVEQILQHRSGIRTLRQIDSESDDYKALMAAKRARDLLPLLTARPLEFAPGSKENYSNGAFMMLGIVIEAVTGRSYGEFVEQVVYRPLGMRASSLVAGGRFAMPMSREDLPEGSEPVPYRYWDHVGWPSGNSVSTADDLMKLARALSGDSFFSPALKASLYPKDTPLGIFQDGATAGVQSAFAISADYSTRMVLLSNQDQPAGMLMGMTMARAAGMMGPPVCKPTAAPGP